MHTTIIKAYSEYKSKYLSTSTFKKSGREHLKEGKSQVMRMSVQQLARKCLHNTLVLWNISLCHTPVELIQESPALISPCSTLVARPLYVSKVRSLWMAVLILHREAILIHDGSWISELWEFIKIMKHVYTSLAHFSTFQMNGFKNKSWEQTWYNGEKISEHISHTLNI